MCIKFWVSTEAHYMKIVYAEEERKTVKNNVIEYVPFIKEHV